jgi:hypothetical protein
VASDLDEVELGVILEHLGDVLDQLVRLGVDLRQTRLEQDLVVDLDLGARHLDRRLDVGAAILVLEAVHDLGLLGALVGIATDPVLVGVVRRAAVLGVRGQAVFLVGRALVVLVGDAVAVAIHDLGWGRRRLGGLGLELHGPRAAGE